MTRRKALYWGVQPVLLPSLQSTDRMVEEAASWLRKSGKVKLGGIIAVMAGTPIPVEGGQVVERDGFIFADILPSV